MRTWKISVLFELAGHKENRKTCATRKFKVWTKRVRPNKSQLLVRLAKNLAITLAFYKSINFTKYQLYQNLLYWRHSSVLKIPTSMFIVKICYKWKIFKKKKIKVSKRLIYKDNTTRLIVHFVSLSFKTNSLICLITNKLNQIPYSLNRILNILKLILIITQSNVSTHKVSFQRVLLIQKFFRI